jgi:hypothetical protein
VWLLGWTAAQEVEVHDHVGPRGVRRRRWSAGTASAFQAECIHHVWNPGPAPAASIHVYSPPLASMTYYERAAGGALWAARTERFDEAATVHGELHA